jgi:hypothetical protein
MTVKEQAHSKGPEDNVHQFVPRKRSPARSSDQAELVNPAVAPDATVTLTDDDDPGPTAA